MDAQDKKAVLDALEYIKNVLEILPATVIPHCEAKIAAYRNTDFVIGTLKNAWNNEETAVEPQEV